ncbi:MAG: undecaprenyl-phosphate glucose phosphotransferase [Gallionella sp.]
MIYWDLSLKKQSSVLRAILHAFDWVGIMLTAWAAHRIYLGSWVMPSSYSIVVGVTVLLAALLFPRFNLYRAWRSASIFDEVRAITIAWVLVLFLLFAFAFSTQKGIQFSRGWIGIWSLLGWLILISGRIVLRVGLRWLRSHGFNQRSIVVVGSNNLGGEVVRRLMKSPWMGLRVVAFFCTEAPVPGLKVHRVPVVEGTEDIAALVARERIDQVWIAMPFKDEDMVKIILHELRHSTVDIRYVPDLFGFRMMNHAISEVAGLPVIDLSVSPMDGTNRLIKGMEDRLLALLILMLISPLMVFIAIGVKLSSPGSVFYRQERVGWNGKIFMMFKFRSMPENVEGGVVQWGGAKNKQVTPFGAFLRKSSLDELPQLFNVLRGDMSIVGPRPERPMFVEKFKDEIPDYMKKHLVKAGITGWAQVNGWRGDTDLAKRIEHDLYYIENWSFWFDMRIIILTVFKGFINTNAY